LIRFILIAGSSFLFDFELLYAFSYYFRLIAYFEKYPFVSLSYIFILAVFLASAAVE